MTRTTRSGHQDIIEILKARGPVTAGDLVRALGVSRATLAKRLSGALPGIVAIGRTRNLRYALLRSPAGLESELPLFRVNEEGRLRPFGKLLVLHGGFFAAEPGARVFSALHPEIPDMAPQGFMGRAFARHYAPSLNLPARLEDWSDDHVLKAVASRGEDLPGNLIVGKESAERWQGLSGRTMKRLPFAQLAELALNEQTVGSSAGGERPKFSVFADRRHRLVKFAGPLRNGAERRWRDLMWCETLAGDILAEGGVPAATARFTEADNHAFLETERFDRLGAHGRRPYLSFAAVEGFLYGEFDTWSALAQRLSRAGLLADADATRIKLADAFCRLIGDTDRHFHNMGLFPEFAVEHSLVPESYRLAPVFDKSPMLFAPVAGRLVERAYALPIPGADVIEAWEDAVVLAKIFWDRAAREKSLSAKFRKIAGKCLRAQFR